MVGAIGTLVAFLCGWFRDLQTCGAVNTFYKLPTFVPKITASLFSGVLGMQICLHVVRFWKNCIGLFLLSSFLVVELWSEVVRGCFLFCPL